MNLSKSSLQYLLTNFYTELSEVLDLFQDRDSVYVISFLLEHPSTFKTLKVEFNHIPKDQLSSFIMRMLDFGVVKFSRDKYFVTKEGEQFLISIFKMLINSYVNRGVEDERVHEIVTKVIPNRKLKDHRTMLIEDLVESIHRDYRKRERKHKK